MAPLLSIEDLTVALPSGGDRAHAIEGVSLHIGRGETVCLVGESGSGKSVTAFSVMRLLAGSLRPVSGRILFDGRDLVQESEREMRRLRGTRLSMIFQEPMTALSPTMTVGRHIEEPFRVHGGLGRRERRERVLDLMAQVRLPNPADLVGRYPHELSGGQRQRVMIAAALALDPALLIADEPTTALDVTTQAQILSLMKDLQGRSKAGILFVTHDLGVVQEIADRVVVMRQGQVVEQGSAAEILGRPQHAYTQHLLAAIPGPAHRRRSGPATDAPEILRVEKLGKVYHSGGMMRARRVANAVQEVDLRIRQGETVALVGESGSGKSTVARCIARLLAPTEGRISLAGVDLDATEAKPGGLANQVQIVFQDPNRSLDPKWTVGRSMLEGMRNIGVPRPDARHRAGELLQKVGISPEALDRYPHEFSGGQRQRICIARALSTRPKLLIADEAVSALDVSVQAQVLTLLETIQREFSLGMLFITHDLRVAAQIADSIAVMHRGRIVEQGPAMQVIDDPQHEYTRLLFSSAPGHGTSSVS